jgi:hypothetical protein
MKNLIIRNLAFVSLFLTSIPLLSIAQKVPISKKHKAATVFNIDLHSAYQKRDNFPLSKIVESIIYIPLETTDKNILDEYLRRIVITKSEIFVFVFGQGVYRFTSNGKFVNKIGRVGRGPAECVKPKDMTLDSVNKYVILLDENKLVKYDYGGSFIKKYPLGFTSESILQIQDNMMLLNDMDYLFKNPGERFSFKFFSLEQNRTISKVTCEKKDKIPFSICNPIMYNYNNQKYIKDYWSDTIYQVIDPYNLKAYAALQTGKFRYRDSDDKSIYTGNANPEDTWVVDIPYISETDRFIFLISNNGLFVYDKALNETICCNFKIVDNNASLFKNDLTKGPDLQTFIYNNTLNNNTQVSYNNALDFFENNSIKLKSGLDKSLKNLSPDDNQVLVIIKFKRGKKLE